MPSHFNASGQPWHESNCDRIAMLTKELDECRAEARRVVDQIAGLATHDAATGLLNVVGMVEYIEIAIDRLDRTGEPFGVMLVRIPELGVITNRAERPGHAEAQRRIGNGVIGGLRAVDRVGLADRSSFLITLPELAPEGAAAVVDRVSRALEAASVVTSAGDPVALHPEIGLVVSHAKALVDVPMLLDILWTTTNLARFRSPTLTLAPPLSSAGVTLPTG